MCALVGSFGLTAEDPGHSPLRVEAHHHIGAFVGDPNIVVTIDANRMRKGPGVQIPADFAHILACGIEFEQLRSGCPVRRAAAVAARQHKHVFFGVDRDAGDFAEI